MSKHTRYTRTVPVATYTKHIARARNPQLYFHTSRTWAWVMNDDNPLVQFVHDVSNRIHLPRVKRIIRIEEDSHGGHFEQEYALCSVAFLKNRNMGMVWDEKTQTRMFNKLIDMGYAKVIKLGMPPRRYVYIDVLKIEQDVDVWIKKNRPDMECEYEYGYGGVEFTEVNDARNGVNVAPRNGVNVDARNGVQRRKKEKKEEIEEERGGKPPLSPPPSKPSPEKGTKKPVPAGSTKNVRASWKKGTKPHELAAQQLHTALRENNRIVNGTSDAVWSVPFEELETAGVPYQKVLAWYCKHCSREDESTYKLPYIQNGRQFRQHFDWIAKARDKGMPGKPPKVRNVIDGDGDEFETREEYLW